MDVLTTVKELKEWQAKVQPDLEEAGRNIDEMIKAILQLKDLAQGADMRLYQVLTDRIDNLIIRVTELERRR